MKGLRASVVIGCLTSLACAGIGPLGGGGSERAQALCDHLAKTNETTCETVAVGQVARINDLDIHVDRVASWVGESSLPNIKNSDERRRFESVDNQALVLEVAYTNTAPVKASIGIVSYLTTGDGDEVFNSPYNAAVYREDHPDWLDLWEHPTVGPGKTARTALVFPVATSAVEGSLLVLRRNEKRPDPKDPRGRMKTFVEELLVVDLGPPT